MELTANQKRKGILLELKELLTSAAFPFLIQIFLSASVILFADYSGDKALQVFVIIFGELLLMGAFFIFGKMNGTTAYRQTIQHKAKREMESDSITAYLKTGDYAVWKGIVIALIAIVPFLIFQLVQCVAPNTVCELILKYGFGWAAYPFIVIFGSDEAFSQWLNFIWIVFPIAVHTAAYIYGASKEAKNQAKADEAREVKNRK